MLDSTNLHGEASKVNIPVIGVVDSNNSQTGIDYPIVANTQSLRFYHTFAHMLVRAIKDGSTLREDLDKYEVAPTATSRGRGPPRTGRGGRY